MDMGVTIKDIANLAGVSYSTVSKALNDSPLVKKDTKHRIIKIAKEMGYQPNFAAQKLVSKKTKIIGLIWPTIERIALSTLVSKISEEINKASYSMILSIDPLDKAMETFKAFQVDGIILFEDNSEVDINPGIIPLVSYGVSNKKSYSVIDANHEQAITDAVNYLYQLGHRNISYIGYMSPIDSLQMEKYYGFQKAMNNLGLKVDKTNVINTGGLDWYDGFLTTKRVFENYSYRPTALVSGSYEISIGIIRAVKEKNLIIPKDLSLISYDNLPQMASMEIPLTCVGVPIDELAKKIAKKIIELIENDKLDSSITKMTPKLCERNSCAPPILDKSLK